MHLRWPTAWTRVGPSGDRFVQLRAVTASGIALETAANSEYYLK